MYVPSSPNTTMPVFSIVAEDYQFGSLDCLSYAYQLTDPKEQDYWHTNRTKPKIRKTS